MGRVALLLLALLAARPGAARGVDAAGEVADAPPAAPAPSPAPTPTTWAFSPSVYTYIVPRGRSYANPNLAADRDWLHLEARYDYEDLDTASLWLGYNLAFGRELTVGLTPMVGGVVGHTTGVAPGWELSAGWRGIALSSQGEYVADTAHHTDSFLYTWTELSESPVEWGRFGVVIQRTKVYETSADIERGALVGFSWGAFQLTTYVLGIGQGAPTIVLGLAVDP